jgi:hypothetical protein
METCMICGNPFKPFGRHKICSAECRAENNRGAQRKHRAKKAAKPCRPTDEPMQPRTVTPPTADERETALKYGWCVRHLDRPSLKNRAGQPIGMCAECSAVKAPCGPARRRES